MIIKVCDNCGYESKYEEKDLIFVSCLICGNILPVHIKPIYTLKDNTAEPSGDVSLK